jgi:predicted transcriptional regulator
LAFHPSQKTTLMPNKINTILLFLLIAGALLSCSPRNISTKYYFQNEATLDTIEESYKKINAKTPFNVGFSDRRFSTISLEILTDTLSYIYEFRMNEPRLTDTLLKYKINAVAVTAIIRQMHSIRCAWLNESDYYVDGRKHSLILMSIKPVALKRPFAYSKYYVLSYFPQPQYFDSEGRLLQKRKLNELRKINGEIFRRINSKVCYTISGRFR